MQSDWQSTKDHNLRSGTNIEIVGGLLSLTWMGLTTVSNRREMAFTQPVEEERIGCSRLMIENMPVCVLLTH